jgi:hypothetical protein
MPRGHVLPDGERIAALRGEADLTQWQLAGEAGYGLRTIGKIEDGQPTGAGTLSAVATVLSRRLKRSVSLGDLIRRPGEGACCECCAAQAPCIVQEGVKSLDLRAWHPVSGNGNGTESRAVLNDHYRFRRVAPDLASFQFHYTSDGPRIEGTCLSHPEGYEWQLVESKTKEGLQANIAYRMRVQREKEDGGQEVHNQITYLNAFRDGRCEWFRTHVVFPTEALSVLALFPEVKRCRSVRGVIRRHPAEPFQETREVPLLFQSGEIVFWRLTTPQQGDTYQLEWEW